jgi:hypothetical protein
VPNRVANIRRSAQRCSASTTGCSPANRRRHGAGDCQWFVDRHIIHAVRFASRLYRHCRPIQGTHEPQEDSQLSAARGIFQAFLNDAHECLVNLCGQVLKDGSDKSGGAVSIVHCPPAIHCPGDGCVCTVWLASTLQRPTISRTNRVDDTVAGRRKDRSTNAFCSEMSKKPRCIAACRRRTFVSDSIGPALGIGMVAPGIPASTNHRSRLQ